MVGDAPNVWRIVSLNWRMLANPAANATSVNGSVGGLDQDAGGVGPAGPRQGEGPGTDRRREEAIEVPLADGHAPGEAADALAVDEAVGDQLHRPADEVAADVPLG